MVFKSQFAKTVGGLESAHTIGYVQNASSVTENQFANTTDSSTNAGPAMGQLFVFTIHERRNVKSAKGLQYANMEGTNTNVETVEEN